MVGHKTLITYFLISLFVLHFGWYGQSQAGVMPIEQVEELGMARLERIASEANSFEDFLNNQSLLNRYQEALSEYYGKQNPGFDSFFENRIEDLRKLVRSTPGFAEQAWEKLDWQKKSFRVTSSMSSSGISLDVNQFELQVLPGLRQELKQMARSSLEEVGDTRAFSESRLIDEETLARYFREVKDELAEIGNLPKKQKGLAIKSLKEGARVRAIQAYFAYYFFDLPNISAMIRTGDADIIMHALDLIPKMNNYATEIIDLHSLEEVRALGDFPGMFNISNNDQIDTLTFVRKAFDQARAGKREFELIPSAGTDDAMIRQTNLQKKSLIERLNSENSLFKLEVMEQPHNKKIILKPTGGKNGSLSLVSMPRRFHGVFAPIRHTECVRDLCAKWGVSLIRDAQYYFTETNNGKMSGYIQILPGKDDSGRMFGAVEVMTPSSSGEVVELDKEAVRLAKKATFDLITDGLYDRMPTDWKGLVISNGTQSNNASGKSAVYSSTSYILGEDAGVKPGQLKLVLDPVADSMPGTGASYSSEKFIGDGINRDGQELRILAPKEFRASFTQEEYLNRYLMRAIMGKTLAGLDTMGEHFNFYRPTSEQLEDWKALRNIPWDWLSEEQRSSLFSNSEVLSRLFRDESNFPHNNPTIRSYILQNEEVFTNIVNHAHRHPKRPILNALLLDQEIKERVLNKSARGAIVNALLGGDRTHERAIFEVYSRRVDMEEFLNHQEVRTLFYDWYFGTTYSHVSNLKRRKSFSFIERYYNDALVTEEFVDRIRSENVEIQKRAIVTFAQSSELERIGAEGVDLVRESINSERFIDFIRQELHQPQYSSFLTDLQSKMTKVGLKDEFDEVLLRASRDLFSRENIDLSSTLASKFPSSEIFLKNRRLARAALEGLRNHELYESLFTNMNRQVTIDDVSKGWAKILLMMDDHSEQGYRQLAETLLADYTQNPHFSRWNYDRQTSFSHLIKIVAEEYQDAPLFKNKKFSEALLGELRRLGGAANILNLKNDHGYTKTFHRSIYAVMVESNYLRKIALSSPEDSRLVLNHLLALQASVSSDSTFSKKHPLILDEMTTYLFESNSNGKLRAGILDQKLDNWLPIRYILQLEDSMATQLIQSVAYNEQITANPQRFLSDVSTLAGKNSTSFKRLVELSSMRGTLENALESLMSFSSDRHIIDAFFQKPLVDIFDKEELARKIFTKTLAESPESIVSLITFLKSKKISSDVIDSFYSDSRTIGMIQSGELRLSQYEFMNFLKNSSTESIDELYENSNVRKFVAQNLYSMSELHTAKNISKITPLFSYDDFQREFLDSIMSEQEFFRNARMILKKNFVDKLDRALILEKLGQRSVGELITNGLYHHYDDYRRFSYQLIATYPEILSENSPIVSRVRRMLLSSDYWEQEQTLYILKSKAGKAMLDHPEVGELISRDVEAAEMPNQTKSKILRLMAKNTSPESSCFNIVNMLLN